MTIAVMKTKAEQGFSEQFDAVSARLPGSADVLALRKAALGLFASLGLPHRRVEEWKYTDLRAALKEAYPVEAGAPAGISADDLNAALGPHLAALDDVRLVFVDGVFVPALSRFEAVKGSQYQFDRLATALEAHGFDWLRDSLTAGHDMRGEAIVALNTAFASDGALLRVEPGATLSKPLHLVFVASGDRAKSTFVRNAILIGAKASVTLLESHVSLTGSARHANAVTDIQIEDGAQFAHIKCLNEGAAASHVATAFVSIAADASYRSFQFTAATALVRNQCVITFAGEGAKIDFSGAFLVRGSEHVDTTLVVDHAVPRCESRELFRGVLDDRARGVFQGKIIVRPDAQKTDGKQMAQALMLSADAEFDAKPELEIYADDVVCGHGATCMELDDDLLFYFRSRGIPKAEAKALLITSFVAEAIDKVENEDIRTALLAKADAWLLAKSD